MRPAAIALVLLAPSAAWSASVDCARPGGSVETAVCESARLAHLDRIVSDRYGAILGAVSDDAADAVRRRHRAWIEARDGCGQDAACLEAAYRSRLRALGL